MVLESTSARRSAYSSACWRTEGIHISGAADAQHIRQGVVRPFKPVHAHGHGQVLSGRVSVEQALGIHIAPQQNGVHPDQRGGGQTGGSLCHLAQFDFTFLTAQADKGEDPKGHRQVGIRGEHDLCGGVARHEYQGGPQRGDQGMDYRPFSGTPHCCGASAQKEQEQGKTHHASLHQGLDIVIMDVFGLIVEGLHAADAVFKGPHTQADNRASLKELQAVREKRLPAGWRSRWRRGPGADWR